MNLAFANFSNNHYSIKEVSICHKTIIQMIFLEKMVLLTTKDKAIVFRVFEYKVSAFKFLDTTIEELNQNKMIILIPLQLLKLRKLLEKERSEENLELLKI